MKNIRPIFSRPFLLILFSCAFQICFAQKNPQTIAKEYQKKIDAAKTPEEKMRLAKELQEILLPNELKPQSTNDLAKETAIRQEYISKIQAAKTAEEKSILFKEMQQKLGQPADPNKPISSSTIQQIVKANDQLYQVDYSYTLTAENSGSFGGKECGEANCRESCNGSDRIMLSGRFVSKMSKNYGFWKLAGIGDSLQNFTANGSGESVGNGICTQNKCGDKGTWEIKTTKKVEYSIARKEERIANFNYDLYSKDWQISIEVPSTTTTNKIGCDGASSQTNAGSFIIGAASSNSSYSIKEEKENILRIQGTEVIENIGDNCHCTQKTTIILVVTISPYKKKDEKYEAIILPTSQTPIAGYENWIPIGPAMDGKGGEPDKGNTLYFKVVVREKQDTTKIYTKPYNIKFELSSSKNPGYASNYPAYTENPNIEDDLKFDDETINSPAFLNITNNIAQTTEFGVNAILCIRSYDYGSYGSLNANVILSENDELLQASPYYDKNLIGISIPFDLNSNHIADKWEKDEGILNKNVASNWDEDELPNNGNNGDDIVVFDEYRGFYLENDKTKEYLRLKANRKEIITYPVSTSRKKEVLAEGTKLYEKVTSIDGKPGIKTFTINAYNNMEGYVARNGEIESQFRKWINYNSPLKEHISTVIPLWAFGQHTLTKVDSLLLLKQYSEETVKNLMHRGEASTFNLSNIPIGKGNYYPREVDYILFRLEYANDVFKKMFDWFRPFCGKTDSCYANIDRHIKHASEKYRAPIDNQTPIGQILKDNYEVIFDNFLRWTVPHELGHATKIHHHNVQDPDPINNNAYYKGERNCPMRYWASTDIPFPDCERNWDWYIMALSNTWDPSTMVTPDKIPMLFCTKSDDCWRQLSLKKK